ncbi:hypothetical protein F5Y01DRAFT_281510 [Xylaria sp. FL0043]|nr:hypothetical protein F5Y01DRAFT_281510 [Xylaria sp. FL0043]
MGYLTFYSLSFSLGVLIFGLGQESLFHVLSIFSSFSLLKPASSDNISASLIGARSTVGHTSAYAPHAGGLRQVLSGIYGRPQRRSFLSHISDEMRLWPSKL